MRKASLTLAIGRTGKRRLVSRARFTTLRWTGGWIARTLLLSGEERPDDRRRAVMDLGELTPCVMGRGPVVSILPVGRNLWVLTRQSVCALLDGSAHAWPLPEKGEWLAADDDGAVVCTRRGLFLPLTKTWWPLALRGPIGVVTLSSSTVVIDGGEDSGHPTDRSNWRLVVDRTTGVPGPLTITGQGGFWSASCERTAVRTPKGEACLRNGVLSWQGRRWHLPGGATTLAAEGDGLLVGTDQGKVYRLG